MMSYIADLHIHSPYAHATSKYLSLESLYQWAQIKGIDVIGTGDFTHPAWLDTLKTALIPAGNGFYQLKKPPTTGGLPGICPPHRQVYFCLSAEVSTIYSYQGSVRKSHHLLYAPDFDTVEQLNKKLARIGNLQADGRPILGLSARNLLEIVCETSAACYLIPAHIWTPWFSILGSRSGYDAVKDAFRDLSERVFALETGLSSDPAMNWRLSSLDQYTMVSNSDAHSPQKLGREVSRFQTTLSYEALFKAIRTREGFAGTLEYFPEEGKYHLDGHRKCQICFTPAQTLQHKGICPTCGRKLTIGVLHRIEALADRLIPQKPPHAADFDYIVPLPEIIAQIIGQGVSTKKVIHMFVKMINQFGDEFTLLRQTPISDIAKHYPPPYAIAIDRLRRHQVQRKAGYDGVYGKMILWEPSEKVKTKSLFDT